MPEEADLLVAMPVCGCYAAADVSSDDVCAEWHACARDGGAPSSPRIARTRSALPGQCRVGTITAYQDSGGAGRCEMNADLGGRFNPAPGWYPDPRGQGLTRYWDGRDWTQHTRPAPHSSGTSLPHEAIGSQSHKSVQPSSKSRKAVWISGGFGLGVLAILLVVIVAKGSGLNQSASEKFYNDTKEYGVSQDKTMVTLGTRETVADVICRYTRDGKDPLTFTDVFNKVGSATAFNPNEAKVSAYWAIVDVCPDQQNKLDASWRDAVRQSTN